MHEQATILSPSEHTKLYGTLAVPNHPTDALIIFVYGLQGNQNQPLFADGAMFFANHGYATFRFYLYTMQKDARRFDTTIL